MKDVDKKTVTQNDVAREAGVTRSMVSYVISGNSERSVAPETRKRILEVIDRLGYRPNKAAQALQQGDVAFASKKIGVIIRDAEIFRRPYYAEILAGIHTAAHEHNFHVSFIRFFGELKDPVLFNELIHMEEIGGLILVGLEECVKTEEDKKIIDRIRERIKKVVCVEWQYQGLTSILFNRQETARHAAEHLFANGYTNVGYIGQNDDRVLGVQQVLLAQGKKSERKDFYIGECYNMTTGYNVIKEAAKTVTLPSALVCGSDEVAIGVLCYLNEKNIKIPEQVALISIDNLEMSGYTNPPLTTMNVQKTAMGEKAVEMIFKGAVGQNEDAVSINLPTNIVLRESC